MQRYLQDADWPVGGWTAGYGIENAAIYDKLTQYFEIRSPRVWYGFSPESGWGWYYRAMGTLECYYLGDSVRAVLYDLHSKRAKGARLRQTLVP